MLAPLRQLLADLLYYADHLHGRSTTSRRRAVSYITVGSPLGSLQRLTGAGARLACLVQTGVVRAPQAGQGSGAAFYDKPSRTILKGRYDFIVAGVTAARRYPVFKQVSPARVSTGSPRTALVMLDEVAAESRTRPMTSRRRACCKNSPGSSSSDGSRK
jgi:hypothetical protein